MTTENQDTKTPSRFADFDLAPAIRRGIEAAGFTEPRPIQTQAIPATLEGRDILGLAQTGTGKTAAFALPLLQRLIDRAKPGPRVLILAPTREVASQISEEIRLLGRFTRVRVATIFGGVSARPQIDTLRARPEIVVACPGRLLDLLQQRALRLDGIEMLVLDEADHMFDMGFLPDVRRILALCPDKRQNLMFSATMPPEIRRLANKILHDAHVVELKHSKPASTIAHALYPVENQNKIRLLEHLLAQDEFRSGIVFTRTKHRAKKLAQALNQTGHRVAALQGNMSQNQRDRAMNGFRKGAYDILVATDIAARGIDVEQVSHVVNFDMPNTPDAYTHRIGRTGRSERSGKAYTFVTAEDSAMVRAVEQRIDAAIPLRSVDGIESIPFPVHGPQGQAQRRPAQRPAAGKNRRPAGRRRSSGPGGQRPGAASSSRSRSGGAGRRRAS